MLQSYLINNIINKICNYKHTEKCNANWTNQEWMKIKQNLINLKYMQLSNFVALCCCFSYVKFCLSMKIKLLSIIIVYKIIKSSWISQKALQ